MRSFFPSLSTIVTIPTAQYAEYYDSPEARQKADLFSDDYYISKNDPVGFYKNGASTSSVQWVLKDPAYDDTQYVVRNGAALVWDMLYGANDQLKPQRRFLRPWRHFRPRPPQDRDHLLLFVLGREIREDIEVGAQRGAVVHVG